jgi:hypothetical protein
LKSGKKLDNDFSLVLVDKFLDTFVSTSMNRQPYLAIEVNPSAFAGDSALVAEPLAVAALGIGKAAGTNKSRTTTDNVCGAPSYLVSSVQTSTHSSID